MYSQGENSQSRIRAFFLQETNFLLQSLGSVYSIFDYVHARLYAFEMLFSGPTMQKSTNLSNMRRWYQIKNLKYLKFEAEVT